MATDPAIELAESGKRMMEAVNLHVSASLALDRTEPGYVVIRLSDGSSPDGVYYDNRKDAARHFTFDPYVTFIKVGKDSMSLEEAKNQLKFVRMAYRRGARFVEEEPVMLHLNEYNFGGQQ